MATLFIQLPDDFEEKYAKYRKQLSLSRQQKLYQGDKPITKTQIRSAAKILTENLTPQETVDWLQDICDDIGLDFTVAGSLPQDSNVVVVISSNDDLLIYNLLAIQKKFGSAILSAVFAQFESIEFCGGEEDALKSLTARFDNIFRRKPATVDSLRSSMVDTLGKDFVDHLSQRIDRVLHLAKTVILADRNDRQNVEKAYNRGVRADAYLKAYRKKNTGQKIHSIVGEVSPPKLIYKTSENEYENEYVISSFENADSKKPGFYSEYVTSALADLDNAIDLLEKKALEQTVKTHEADRVDKHDSILCDNSSTQSKGEVKNILKKSNLQWHDVEIKFIDDNNVQILEKGMMKEKGDYETFGFKKPDDVPWLMLRWLSYKNIKIEGYEEKIKLTPENFYAMSDSFERSTDKKGLFQTYKSDLVKALRAYFKIDGDPIPFNRKDREYDPKLKVTPTKELRSSEIYRNGQGLLNF